MALEEGEVFLFTDCESLYAKLKHQDKLLTLKRRWLMGLTLSNLEQKRVTGAEFHNKNLPESFLREDDVYYETIKAFVMKGFGALHGWRTYHVHQDDIWISDLPNDLRKFISVIDDMTNHKLQHFAELLTGCSFKFEKTRWKMKTIIKERLPEDINKIEGSEQLHELLKDPQHFPTNILKLPLHATDRTCLAAWKVLDGLEDMHFSTLSAMYRKLRGIKGYIPKLQAKKSGWGRNVLIDQVRKMCTNMLSKLDEDSKLQEPLAKAMAVANLWSTLIQGCSIPVEFWQFSPEIVALQNEIAKAIWLLKEKVRFPELKNLQYFLDPTAKLSNRSLRAAVNNLLTEFLFECSDMDVIPELLFETLSIINRTSRSAPYKFFSEEEIQEEVENVLNVSGQMKQILLDLLPEYEYDQDFADAYMENLEDSDVGDDYNWERGDVTHAVISENEHPFLPNMGYGQTETIGESSPSNLTDFHVRGEHQDITARNSINLSTFMSTSSCAQFDSLDDLEGTQSHASGEISSVLSGTHLRTKRSNCVSPLQLGDNSLRNNTEWREITDYSGKPPDSVSFNLNCNGCLNRNQYLNVQEACDRTTLVAYQLIGCILNEFAQIEGLDFDYADDSYLIAENSIGKVSQAAKEEYNSIENLSPGSGMVQVLDELLSSFSQRKDKVS